MILTLNVTVGLPVTLAKMLHNWQQKNIGLGHVSS